MFRNRLIYSLFLVLIIFALLSILPIALITQKEIRESAGIGNTAEVIERVTNSFITLSFYVFILAFLVSLFLSRKLLLPLRELYRGAMAVRDGRLDSTISAPSYDELGEVIGVFNETVLSLKNKTEEIERKNREQKKYEDDLSQKNKELVAINSIADLLSRSLDAKDTIRNVVKRLVDMLDMDDGGVFLIDKANMALVCYQTDKSMPFGDNIPSKVIETGRIHTCSDIAEEEGTAPEWREFDIRGCCCIPLRGKDGILGTLYLMSFEPHQFTDEEKRILSSVGDMTGIALENIRLYEEMNNLMLIEKGIAEVVCNSISEGLYTVDTNYVITSVNRAAEKMLGVPAKNLIGRKCMDAISHYGSGDDRRLCGDECPLFHAIQGKHMSREMDYIYPSGKRISLSVSCSPLIDAKGALIGAVKVFRDITREKEIDRMKTDFVKIISHEFRTPLSAIVGMTEMLLERDIEEERAREYIGTIMNEGIRLSGMVTDLLDISRIESGERVFNESAVDFNMLLHDIKNIFSDIIRKREIKIDAFVAGDVNGFRGDEGKLRQLLLNIVGNSINYSDSGSSIDIVVKKEAENLQIKVSDTGWGIPLDDMPLLTKKFFRGNHGSRIKGTGLGLSICREIAQLHGGDFNIESKLGTGTTVTVNLPWKSNL